MPALGVGIMRQDRRKHPYPRYLRKRNYSTHLESIHGVDVSETNTRVLQLIQAASDGRKKATVLPPLPIEREPTFQRQPRTLQTLQGNPEEAGESHWQIQSKKVSMDVDKRIVNHLRRKMNKRLQQRLTALDPSSDETYNNDGQEWANAKKPGSVKTPRNHENELFNKYSDTGEKLTVKQSQRKPSLKKSKHNGHTNGHVNGHEGPTREAMKRDNHVSQNDTTTSRPARVPSVTIAVEEVSQQNGVDLIPNSKKVKENGVSTDTSGKTSTKDGDHSEKTDGAEANEASDVEEDDDDEELFDLTRLKTKLGESPEPEEIESFRKLSVSPVQTPCVLRPLTRGDSQYAIGDRMTDILRGHVHRMCQPESTVIPIYISSGFTDTLAEKTAFQEKVSLDLREYCAARGYEIELYDLHWGMTDTITDDHSFPDTCLTSINKCLESNPGVNLLLFLGEKYGPYILPSKIPVEEFNALYDFVQDFRKREIDLIQEQMDDISSARAERERQRQDAESILTDATDHSREKEGSARQVGSGVSSQAKTRRQNADRAKAEAQTIKNLQEQEAALADPEILKEWYSLDENCIPPVYKLDSISTHYRDFANPKKRDAAKNSFTEVAKKIRRIFDEFTPMVITDPFARKKYFTTMIGLEIEHGILETDAVDNHCIVVQRTITDISRNLHDSAAVDFTDISHENAHALDKAQSSIIQDLRLETLPTKVGVSNILPYDIEWAAGGVIVGGHRTHQHYIERMCKQVTEKLMRQLCTYFEERKRKVDSKTKLFDEVSQHVAFCHERTKHFQGRKELLQLVKSYLRSRCPSPLVLYGKAGCGKTALLCKTAKETHKWFRGQNMSVLLRVIGITTSSTNVRSLLRELCLQMCHVFGTNEDDVPTDFKGLMNDFTRQLSLATPENPIVIILDSLDRLSDDHEGRKLNWLPKELPKNAYIIVSTNQDDKYECFDSLKKGIPETSEAYIEIPELPEHDAITILEHWLNKSDKTFTDEQFEFLVESFKKCPMPLFLKIAFQDALSWTSLTPLDQIKFGENVRKQASFKFGKLETKHGEPLVRRALGYITASRNGLTNNEIVDILSLDDAVMDDVMSVYHPPRRRFPTILWVRLRDDLHEYITVIKSQKMRTLQWAHAQFKEAAEERYLLARDKAASYHKAMAEYFLGTWAKKAKPYPGNDKGMLRYVSPQPLYFEPENSIKDGSDRVYNLRRVNELPHHLLNSSQTELYKSQGLCNFEWVLAKLCGTSLRALVEEYQIGLQVDPTDIDLKTLSDTIQLSATALTNDPRQLASQMIGRLHGMIARDIPATAGDPPKYPYLHSFYDQAKMPSMLSLIPSISCLSEPGGILFDLLSGHSEPITAMTLTTEGLKALTASADNTIKLWNIRTGRVMKTIDGTGTNVKSIIPALNNALVATVEGSVIRVWNIRFSQCVLTIDHYLDPPVLGTAGEGKYLVALFDGINIMRTWNLKKQIMPMVCEARIEDNSVYKDNSLLIAASSFDDKVLHAFRGANMATVQHARSGKVIHTLKCNEKSSSAVSLGVTRDYYIVACRQQYMTLHEIHQLELFDLKKGNYLRSVRGCTHDHMTSLHLNYMGSHAIAICCSEKTATSDIAIWNLETEDHKHLARHAGVSLMGACVDFKYCLTAARGDKTLRIWNLSGKVNQSMPKLKKSLGVTQIIPMVDNPRYVVARQMNSGPISVWNVVRAKILQNAVRIERGLSETADVVIVRNTRVVILSDRGFSSASDSSRPVFQTVFIYDLREKKYLKKLSGCYITPCPAHEYIMLDNENLLGLSDNRSHFVVWSLVNGHVVRRIKPNRELFQKSPSHTERSLTVRNSKEVMTPWDLRAESSSAKQRRRDEEVEQERKRHEELRKEKDNGIEQYIISENQNIAVASYFAHHLCVFDISTEKHLHVIETPFSMLFLHSAALTPDGSFLVLPNYDEEKKTSYVTMWDCHTGEIKKRLKNESNVMALAILDDGSRIIIGRDKNELHIWDPMSANGLRKIKGYPGLQFNAESKIFVTNGGTQAVVFAGDISVWDIERGVVLAVFTPDMKINCCKVAMDGQLVTFGLHDIPDVVILRLANKDTPSLEILGEDIMGEKVEETDDEEEEEDY
ncbi:NACHT and WD repeat domain-containing protein 2-like [Ylistrum balloti]|uniref:NACHT and WD repeat domain-containing protein 2-like n=1 Tax=Ylistrum balloti TaxID=509963 RepID=UPI002905A62E|nr:NACHT and WD repeat domain-containing protein 2-like [Ylistrum balloti]